MYIPKGGNKMTIRTTGKARYTVKTQTEIDENNKFNNKWKETEESKHEQLDEIDAWE